MTSLIVFFVMSKIRIHINKVYAIGFKFYNKSELRTETKKKSFLSYFQSVNLIHVIVAGPFLKLYMSTKKLHEIINAFISLLLFYLGFAMNWARYCCHSRHTKAGDSINIRGRESVQLFRPRSFYLLRRTITERLQTERNPSYKCSR